MRSSAPIIGSTVDFRLEKEPLRIGGNEGISMPSFNRSASSRSDCRAFSIAKKELMYIFVRRSSIAPMMNVSVRVFAMIIAESESRVVLTPVLIA